ncbi:MAG: leucine-rich repeat domain-containing protein [Ruminococcaceae bacterium]|nr:leucine-rich repeat domain-containing protein [Oscillospiraceae bacterium]
MKETMGETTEEKMIELEKYLFFAKKEDEYVISLSVITKKTAGERLCLPAKYRGLPITEIRGNAFALSDCLSEVVIPEGIRKIGIDAFSYSSVRTVILPYSLERLESGAFSDCADLEQVVFLGDKVLFDCDVFRKCPKLAAENVMQGLALSCDHTKPFVDNETCSEVKKDKVFDWDAAFRDDVFELALKYDSFALFDKVRVLRKITERNLIHLLPLTENAGWSITEECVGELLDISLKNGFVEITAWLLDYKNRKFGFKN